MVNRVRSLGWRAAGSCRVRRLGSRCGLRLTSSDPTRRFDFYIATGQPFLPFAAFSWANESAHLDVLTHSVSTCALSSTARVARCPLPGGLTFSALSPDSAALSARTAPSSPAALLSSGLLLSFSVAARSEQCRALGRCECPGASQGEVASVIGLLQAPHPAFCPPDDCVVSSDFR